jgi:hypothetical protein
LPERLVFRTLNRRYADRGTRFLIYPQGKWLRGFGRPALVYVDAPPGSIRCGPADDAMYVVDADEYKLAYKEAPGTRPPYTGPRYPPASPDASGHFDHLKPPAREFDAATLYACVRSVFTIWETYFGRQLSPVRRPRRVELVPRVDTDNSYADLDYMEFGFANDQRSKPYCENFDVVAHECGHVIGWTVMGKPARRSLAYRANDEACADLIAMVSALHLDAVVDHLLTHSRGDLATPNVLSRIGELSKTRYTRNAFNATRMSDVRGADRRDKYTLARPFTGAAFDVLVGIYVAGLVERRAIPADLVPHHPIRPRDAADVRREFARRFRTRRPLFESALFDARDYFGHLLARALERTPMRRRTHRTVATNMIAADRELSSGRHAEMIRGCFGRRQILPASIR